MEVRPTLPISRPQRTWHPHPARRRAGRDGSAIDGAIGVERHRRARPDRALFGPRASQYPETCTLQQHCCGVGVINVVCCFYARLGQCVQSVGVCHGDSAFPNSGMVRAPYGIPHRLCQIDKTPRHYEKDGCGVRIIRELVSSADAFLRCFPVLFGIF